mmetsp:Transcript_24983/g.63615  ORF Transcript_24983/g.63615 Transcript_24983/m.63615 type:complete len:213 (+) Transcript_24983:535-1173(+)
MRTASCEPRRATSQGPMDRRQAAARAQLRAHGSTGRGATTAVSGSNLSMRVVASSVRQEEGSVAAVSHLPTEDEPLTETVSAGRSVRRQRTVECLHRPADRPLARTTMSGRTEAAAAATADASTTPDSERSTAFNSVVCDVVACTSGSAAATSAEVATPEADCAMSAARVSIPRKPPVRYTPLQISSAITGTARVRAAAVSACAVGMASDAN